jgi:succinate dehydrogenase / fumarate reductase flavoprotein subunit
MTMEIRDGRGVGPEGDHIFLHLDHLDPKNPGRAPAGHYRECEGVRRRRCAPRANPVMPTVHYNMGGIPTNYHGEVLTLKDGNPDHVVPGLMAIGEAACVSVHGANRLGSNSLIDLVVFGRAAGLRCGETVEAGAAQPDLPEDARRRRCRGWTASPCRRRHADIPAAPRYAEGDAEQLRGVPRRAGAS